MTHFITKNKLQKAMAAIMAAAFWLAVWQIAYLCVAQDLLLASPAQAFTRLLLRARELLFWQSVAATCARVVAGFLLALIVGMLLAALSVRFRLVYLLVSPLFGVIRATPVVSFIILVLLWVATNPLPIFIAFLMVAPMVWSNIYTGIVETDRELLEMAKVFRMPRRKIFSMIYMPAVMPYFVSVCSVGLGFSWKSAIAAEVICLPRQAIGREIYNARIYLETADLFAWTIAVILLSLVIEKLVLGALRGFGKSLAATRVKGGGGAA